ncbi:hypothetical protein [Kriegella aquimaris]|uniref:Uncharacterized protein n=1 Tax=Kriegella aquimaris TaxID=192904 RepID=A0A1G9RCS5_9FLAO|nr:hypothetical protein [Kriegella aquimaris]SDM21023.1 hypothetical protein SAMN04488514_10683 [Kriegella aquimaris]
MKSIKIFISILLVLIFVLPSFSQENNQISDEPFLYQVNGRVALRLFEGEYKVPTNSAEISGKYGYDLVGKYKTLVESLEIEYVLLQLRNWKYKTATTSIQDSLAIGKVKMILRGKYRNKGKYKGKSTPFYYIDNTPNIIDQEDQDKVYVMRMTDFKYQLDEGFIRKRYDTSNFHIDWGASLTLPFKMRPEVNDLNMKITPEISLGGFFGLRKRINPYKPHYIYLPVVTAGVTIIGLNKDNVIVEQNTGDAKDGLVFARTVSAGIVIALDDFQLGAVMGWDKAGGEIGKDWIYNDRPWFSFQIGFNFLQRKNEDSDQ